MPVPDALQQLITSADIAVGVLLDADALQQLLNSADIAVAVLLNEDGSAVEMLPLKPRPFPDSTVCALEVAWGPRHLRFAGVLTWTWTDAAIQAHLEAPLSASVITRLCSGFQSYLTAFSDNPTVN